MKQFIIILAVLLAASHINSAPCATSDSAKNKRTAKALWPVFYKIGLQKGLQIKFS